MVLYNVYILYQSSNIHINIYNIVGWFTGVACVVQPVMPILDMLYSSRLVLEQLAGRYGRMPQKWPPVVVAQLRQRHTLLEQRIQRVMCTLSSASYFVLGNLRHGAMH